MEFIISGIQQIGIGVPDVYQAWEWYAKTLGFDVPVFDDPGTADKMLVYTGGKPHKRHAVLAVNMQGGGGLEIWQYTSRVPVKPSFKLQAGDIGIYAIKIKTKDIQNAFQKLTAEQCRILTKITDTPDGGKAFYVSDPYDNLLCIEETTLQNFMDTSSVNGGAIGVVIGVSEMGASIDFYREILGYDTILYDKSGIFSDLRTLPGGTGSFRRVLLTHHHRCGAFSRLMGPSRIELIEALDRTPEKIFEGRYWGDLGFIHLCFDITGMSKLRSLCAEKGHPFTVDSNPETADGKNGTFNMGEAAGHFSYCEDPDGTLIEFVETHKVPIIKKMGWFIDLRKRAPKKPLPDFILKALRFNRKK